MCSGRVEASFILEGFLTGADGVFVGGCHLGDCHYISGNYEALNMERTVKILLEYAGINPERFRREWVSAAEGARFAEVITGFTKRIKELGPLGTSEGKGREELAFEIKAAKRVAESEKLRWVTAKQTEFMENGNKYGEVFTEHEMKRTLEGIIVDELAVQKILLLLREAPRSVREIAERLDLVPPKALQYISGLRRKGIVDLEEIRGESPFYSYRI
jgi:coenzyme F420-reducing hydrogenase delta subunit/DNA-binding transcriptional ArsR family regulator